MTQMGLPASLQSALVRHWTHPSCWSHRLFGHSLAQDDPTLLLITPLLLPPPPLELASSSLPHAATHAAPQDSAAPSKMKRLGPIGYPPSERAEWVPTRDMCESSQIARMRLAT